MSSPISVLQELFTALEKRDESKALDLFTDDAVFFDPHYPVREMVGREAITKGLAWGMESMEQFGFTIEKSYLSEDGNSGSVEVDTHHFLKGGRELRFPQAFFVEVQDGKISGLRAYEPYGPDGIMGIMLGISHMFAKK